MWLHFAESELGTKEGRALTLSPSLNHRHKDRQTERDKDNRKEGGGSS